ncbi:MAG: murein biosynthesis integral membrane protein MurJ [Geminicoccaceae bacterium]|nr:murein biosynthesis integral membrane protein MurJ [Geminicoccaceae bacterium]MDW8340515.1 murein biosynthesis integral membrane protein MurJ [Geminicoccaceae bacterium]
MNLLRAAATVGGFTLLSRVLGFVRDLAIAAVLGAGAAADAFFVAFKLANMLRRLFAEGAFNAGFVPLFARTLEQEGEPAARAFAAHALSVMALLLAGVVLLAELAMPLLVRVIATGFDPQGERYRLAVELSRLTFPYLAAISLAALVSGVLNGLGRFAAAAFAPVLLNLVLIAALALAVATGASAAHLLAAGVFAAGVAQFALVFAAAARAGFVLLPRWPRGPERARLRRLWHLVLPGAFGAGVYQLNLVVDTWFASHLPTGAVSYLFYADRLVQLPLGLVGVALGTALLPLLARQLRAGRIDAARHNFDRALELALFASLPAALGLILLAEPIVRVLFERGAFDRAATEATAAALAAFACGLPAFVLVKVLATGFFAREDTRTPVFVAALCLGANVLVILATIGPFGHVGIALATALSNWINAGLLTLVLVRRGAFVPGARLRSRVLRLLLASGLLSLLLWALRAFGPAPDSLGGLGFALACGAGGYLLFARLTGAFAFSELRAALVRAPAEPAGAAARLDRAKTA